MWRLAISSISQIRLRLRGAANFLRGKTAAQDNENHIRPLLYYGWLCERRECESNGAVAEMEGPQGRALTEKEKAVFCKRIEHRFQIHCGSRWVT